MREIKFRCRTNTGDKLWHVFKLPTWHLEMSLDHYDLESWTQYTGLKDKNGKDVYEGDLLRVAKGIVYKIWWSNSSAGFVGSTPNKWASAVNIRKELVQKIRWIVEREGEIIGNIYSNPELLIN